MFHTFIVLFFRWKIHRPLDLKRGRSFDRVGYCFASKADSQGVAICRSLGQEYASDDEYVRYSFFVN